MFGHTFELIIVLLIGLLIFGPKRVIEMGAAAGRMLRELRDAMKDMNWSSITGSSEHESDPLAELRDLPRTFASSILNPPPATTASPPTTATPPEATVPAAEPHDAPAPTVVESEPPHTPSAQSAQSSGASSGSSPEE